MQIQSTSYHYKSPTQPKIKQNKHKKCGGKDMEKLKSLRTAAAAAVESGVMVHQKTKQNYPTIQQLYYWVDNQKFESRVLHTHVCIVQSIQSHP